MKTEKLPKFLRKSPQWNLIKQYPLVWCKHEDKAILLYYCS